MLKMFSQSLTLLFSYSQLIISFPILKEPLFFSFRTSIINTFQHRIVFLIKRLQDFAAPSVCCCCLVICLFFSPFSLISNKSKNLFYCMSFGKKWKKNLYNIFVQKAIKVFWFNKIYIGIFVKVLQKAPCTENKK